MRPRGGWLDFLDFIGDGIEGVLNLADFAPLLALIAVALVLVWVYQKVRAAGGAEVVG